jgi:hypothetical protein
VGLGSFVQVELGEDLLDVGYRSYLLVVLVVVAVAQRRLGPSSSATVRS